MIDTVAMLLCIGGQAALAYGRTKQGFVLAGAGSVAWLMFGIGVQSVALILQSLAFLTLSTIGYMRARDGDAKRT